MRKIVLVSLLCMLFSSMYSQSDIFQSNGIWYYLRGNSDLVVVHPPEGEVYSGTIVIPKEVEVDEHYHKTVFGIDTLAFSGFDDLTIDISSSSLREIRSNAFQGCRNLTLKTTLDKWSSIDIVGGRRIMDDVELFLVDGRELEGSLQLNTYSIGKNIFRGLPNITSVTINEKVQVIRDSAFYGCPVLATVVVKGRLSGRSSASELETAVPLGKGIFANCPSLTSVTIESEMDNTSEAMFSDCGSLSSVVFAEGMKRVGANMFRNCISLTAISLPESISDIGSGAFMGCGGLRSVTMPDGIVTVPENCFRDCSSLTTLNFPSQLKQIDNNAFHGCSSLSVSDKTWSNVSIGSSAFRGCNAIKSMTIAETTTLGYSAFAECKGLETLNLFSSEVKDSAFMRCIGLSHLTLGKECNLRSWGIFSECHGLVSVDFPEGIKYVDVGNFAKCEGLEEITLPVTLEELTNQSFSGFDGCSSLHSINIKDLESFMEVNCHTSIFGRFIKGEPAPVHLLLNGEPVREIHIAEGKTEISRRLFNYVPDIETVYFPTTIKNVNGFYGCYNLSCIYLPGERMVQRPSETMGNYHFNTDGEREDYYKTFTIYVPGSLVDDYSEDEYWGQFGHILPLPGTGEKCATPTISYEKGRLIFSCDTPNAEFVASVSDADIKTWHQAEIDLTSTYVITVYATAKNHLRSDVVTASLCWIDVAADTDTAIDIDTLTELKAMPVLIQSHDGVISISGAKKDESVAIYDFSGNLLTSFNHPGDTMTFTLEQPYNGVAIVKIGKKTVKVVIK